MMKIYHIDHEQFVDVAKYLNRPDDAKEIKKIEVARMTYSHKGGLIRVEKEIRLSLESPTRKLKRDIKNVIRGRES